MALFALFVYKSHVQAKKMTMPLCHSKHFHYGLQRTITWIGLSTDSQKFSVENNKYFPGAGLISTTWAGVPQQIAFLNG